MCKSEPAQPPPRRVVVRTAEGTKVPTELRRVLPDDTLRKLRERAIPLCGDPRGEQGRKGAAEPGKSVEGAHWAGRAEAEPVLAPQAFSPAEPEFAKTP